MYSFMMCRSVQVLMGEDEDSFDTSAIFFSFNQSYVVLASNSL